MSCESSVHVGDKNFTFFANITENCAAVDISGATAKTILFQKPSGVMLEKAALFVTDGTDGQIQYSTVEGDLDEVGIWKIQAVVELGSGSLYHSNMKSFKVMHNISG